MFSGGMVLLVLTLTITTPNVFGPSTEILAGSTVLPLMKCSETANELTARARSLLPKSTVKGEYECRTWTTVPG